MKIFTAGRNNDDQKNAVVVEMGLRKMNIQCWWVKTQDWQEWRRTMQQTVVHTGLYPPTD
jgi:hypothetical protein